MKPTCLIQLSNKHLAIAVGSLKEPSDVEIYDVNKDKVVSRLQLHSDMIDSLLKIELPSSKTKFSNPYITWLLSASRDRQIILWKLIDGKIMKRNKFYIGQAPSTTALVAAGLPQLGNQESAGSHNKNRKTTNELRVPNDNS